MKKDITRIYDKRKVYSRGKYLLIIIAILALQVAIYLGAFSKAEKVIPVQYINYYSLETFSSSIDVLSDLNGEHIILPEVINEREVISYYIEESTNGVVKYNPNDTYYIADAENLTIQVEYGEYITTEESNEENTKIEEESIIPEDISQVTQLGTDDSGEISMLDETEEVIVDTVYLGNIRTRGRRRNKRQSIQIDTKSI